MERKRKKFPEKKKKRERKRGTVVCHENSHLVMEMRTEIDAYGFGSRNKVVFNPIFPPDQQLNFWEH